MRGRRKGRGPTRPWECPGGRAGASFFVLLPHPQQDPPRAPLARPWVSAPGRRSLPEAPLPVCCGECDPESSEVGADGLWAQPRPPHVLHRGWCLWTGPDRAWALAPPLLHKGGDTGQWQGPEGQAGFPSLQTEPWDSGVGEENQGLSSGCGWWGQPCGPRSSRPALGPSSPPLPRPHAG